MSTENDASFNPLAGRGLLAVAWLVAIVASGCAIDNGRDHDSDNGCQPSLLINWQIQDASGAALTCAEAGAAQVTAQINGSSYSETCLPSETHDTIAVSLSGRGKYNVTVALHAVDGAVVGTPQSNTFDVEQCGAVPTTAAPLVP
jgi:hypothetical protein